jgi:hypothetical protein
MIEIQPNDRIEHSSFYVLRKDILYKVQESEIEVGETCCKMYQTPSTPPDFGLLKLTRIKPYKNYKKYLTENELTDSDENFLTFYQKHISDNFEDAGFVEDVCMVCPEGVRSFLVGIGEFKNWYDK